MYFKYLLILLIVAQTPLVSAEDNTVDYQQHVQPVLTKYCAGCHNDQEQEGKFSASSYKSLAKGGEKGGVLIAGDAEKSRLMQLVTSQLKEKMPPEDEPQPTAAEIEILKQWILQGAKAPAVDPLKSLKIDVAEVKSLVNTQPVTALAKDSAGILSAWGTYRVIHLQGTIEGKEITKTIADLPGKITALHFSQDGTKLVVASGIPGLGGYAAIYAIPELNKLQEFRGHADVLYDAELSPDQKILATCSYDKNIILWDTQTGGVLRELNGHNGAVYDLAFSPDGNYLVSGSADDTAKVWRVADGFRLDTLPQPLKEVYCVSFTKDGSRIICSGADQKLRVFNFVSKEKAEINPMLIARFAHEKPVLKFEFTTDGKYLLTMAEDKTVKLWETTNFTQVHAFADMPEIAVTASYDTQHKEFVAYCLNGKQVSFPLPDKFQKPAVEVAIDQSQSTKPAGAGEMKMIAEKEPNNAPAQAQQLTIPCKVTGIIHDPGKPVDEDFFAFSAKSGERLIFEVKADQMKSPLDTHLEVLTEKGERIERVQLQAVRDSYFTFRGKDDSISDDFRVFNWEEMKLNQYLYANGEVVKLFLYPRGPDSGFKVYPAMGKRWAYFDTTPLSHALNEPCYIVEAHAPGAEITPNGLPVFKLYYENDDESQRKSGRDSRLNFTAPADGKYLIRIRDVRGFEGDSFKYELTVKQPAQNFKVNLATKEISLPAGGAREIRITADRMDQFEGPITINFQNLPKGLQVSSPIVIEEGQVQALGVIWLNKDVTELKPDDIKNISIEAQADIYGEVITQKVPAFNSVKLETDPILGVTIHPIDAKPDDRPEGILEVSMHLGETKMLKLTVERGKHKGIVEFGKEDSGRNLPFGVYVDNIGLNGLMLLEDQNEREFFITADSTATPQSRLFHLKSETDKGSCSLPVLLHLLP